MARDYFCILFSKDDADDELLSTTNTNSLSPSPSSKSLPATSKKQFSPPPLLPPQNCRRYPALTVGMTVDDFKAWTINQLYEFLADRCINKTGNKAKLVENAYGAYCMNLPISASDPQEEKLQIEQDAKSKLILENGMVTLKSPSTLIDDWIAAPSHLLETLFHQVNTYLIANDAVKAFKGGRSLLQSGHLNNVMVHMVSPNVR